MSLLNPGAVVGDLCVEGLLREAPGGAVYAAVDGAGARVLLRVLDPALLEGPAALERIGCDLMALQALDHPRVAAVRAIGQEHGRLHYALEDRGRLTLAEAVRRARPLEERELVWLGRELAAGLAAMHAAGVVHGGLGAQSIVLGHDGPVIVDLDWTARGCDPEKDGPRPEDDVAALGRVLAFAATGGPAPRGLREDAPWLRRRVSGLVDAMSVDVLRRPTAEKAARLFAQIARESGVAGEAGADDGGVGAGARGAFADLLETRANGSRAEGAPLALGRFGRYVLLEEVARGGMGVVYRARHADFERVFALKVMLEGALRDETARRRFLREAEAAAALDHPSIVRVHDCGVVEGKAYIAMDFTEGCPLRDVYRGPDAGLEPLLRIFLQVVRAVHYAHSRGIVHRDLKPDNIIVDLQGCPHILDFGVAKRLGEGAGDTLAGEVLGTPAYMPPEQAEARNEDIDTRSDVYALGVTLFELVTRGRLPFEGHSISDTLTRILLDEPPAPSAVRQGVPWEVDAIVLKALEKQRERRYQSAAELADDLERFLGGLPIAARQASLGYRAQKWATRHARRLVVGALCLGAALTTVVVDAARRRAEVAALVAQGEAALARRDVPRAQALFFQALTLDEDDMAAGVGRERAERLLDDVVREARARQALAEASRLVATGETHLAAGRLDQARVAFEQAMAFEEHPASARDGLARVARQLAVREATERLASQRARDAAVARQHEAEGQAHLERGDHRAAQASFLKAIAFGSARGEELLRQAEEGLLLDRMRQVQAEVARRDEAESSRLSGEARAALEAGAFDDARTLFLQVLAFDGRHPVALEGLVEVDRLLRAREAELAQRSRVAQARELLEASREAHARGKHLFRTGEQLEFIRDAYLDALGGYDRALQLGVDLDDARRERTRVTRELAMILRDAGHDELGGFVLRFGGLAAEAPVGPDDLPLDPHLAVVEADRIQVRRAFGGPVRFEPSRAFDPLRGRVRALGDRWRVEVQVRSEPTASLPPTVLCRGLWVRIEDRVTRTVLPTIRIDFDDGPYTRLITVDPRGRVIQPFERARGLDVAGCVARVEAAVMDTLSRAAAAARDQAAASPGKP